MPRPTILLRVAAAWLACTYASPAVAQEPAAPDPFPATAAAPAVPAAPVPPRDEDAEAEVARLSAVFERFAAPARSYAFIGGISGMVVGAGVTAVGAEMLARNGGSEGAAIVAGAGIGSFLGGALVLALPIGLDSEFRGMADRLESRRRAGMPASEIVALAKADWREKAERERAWREFFGWAGLAISGIALAGGTYFALAPQDRSLSRNEQDGYAAALLAYGVFAAIFSEQALLLESRIESTWDAYSAGQAPPSRAAKVTGLIVAPEERGAAVGLRGSF